MDKKSEKLVKMTKKITDAETQNVVEISSKKDETPDVTRGKNNNCCITASGINNIISNLEKKSSVFEKLSKINVNDRIETKANMKYLSWAYAWDEAKRHYPDVNYKIYENANECFYHTDGKTCWVKVGVTIENLEYIEYLPVMDNKNRSIPLGGVTSFDVNKSIQRALTKALARHGLGLYVYAGEDLPDDNVDIKTLNTLESLLCSFGEKIETQYKNGIYKKYKIPKLSELSQPQAEELIQKFKIYKNSSKNVKEEQNAKLG